MSLKKEQAMNALEDSKLFAEFTDCLLALHWNIDACGGKGEIEMDKIRDIAPAILKIIVNYI